LFSRGATFITHAFRRHKHETLSIGVISLMGSTRAPQEPMWKYFEGATDMIRSCSDLDFEQILEVINDGATAYKGVIPVDRWHEPYMTAGELRREMEDGVHFWCYEEQGHLNAVMGLQDKGEVVLIRHAYVRTKRRRKGLGGKLLRHLESGINRPILIGTWAAASWAIAYYEKGGYCLLPPEAKTRLLKRFWKIPERQVETSVVLAKGRWEAL
jgi:GNAT superfamily N-acetyltransferase